MWGDVMRCEGARGRRAETAGQVVGSRSHIKLIRPHWSDGTEVHCGKKKTIKEKPLGCVGRDARVAKPKQQQGRRGGGRGGGVIVEFH